MAIDSPTGTKRERVLVVDDEREHVIGAILGLKARGLEIDHALSKAEAMDRLARHKYDALLLDLRLPSSKIDEPVDDPPIPENGLAILRSLSAGAFEPAGTHRETPVFIVSALHSGSEHWNEVRKLGVKAVFGKPVAPILVAETVRLTLEEA